MQRFRKLSLCAAALGLITSVAVPARAADEQLTMAEQPAATIGHAQGMAYAGTWDGATGTLTKPGGESHALGGGPTVIFESGTFSGGFLITPSFVIPMSRSETFAAEGANVITGIRIWYGATIETFDLTVRIHQAVTGPIGSGAKAEPGKGISIPIKGLAGDTVNVDPETGYPTMMYALDVLLPYPLHLEDGAIRWGMQAFAEEVFQGLHAPEAQTDNNTEAYNANDGSRFQNGQGSGALIKNNVLYVAFMGQEPTFDQAEPITGTLVGRDSIAGRIHTETEVDRFRYEGLAGEQMTANVARKGKTGFEPTMAITDLSTGAVLATGDGEKKVALKKVLLPSDGAYEVTIAGIDGSIGDYRARFSVRPSPTSKKPLLSEDGMGPLATFTAKPGTTLNATVKPLGKGAEPILPPMLMGPLGYVDLSPWLSQKGKTTWRITKAPVPAFGDYALVAGAAPDPGEPAVELKVKAALRKPRTKPNRSHELTSTVEGLWIQKEFETKVNSFRARFSGDKSVDSTIVQVSPSVASPGQVTKATKTVTSFRVAPADLAEVPGALQLTYTLANSIAFIADFGPNGTNTVAQVPAGEKQISDIFVFKDGNPNIIEFLTSDEIWYREITGDVEPPKVEVGTTSSPGDGGGLVALTIECQGAAGYVVFKVDAGDTVTPVFPIARLVADCRPGEKPEDPETTVWVDSSSALDGGAFAYWVAALDDDGRQTVVSGPFFAN